MRLKALIKSGLYSTRHVLSERAYLRLLFMAHMRQRLDLVKPTTFNAKLQWLKLYDLNPLYTTLVDKIEVKKWVADRIGSEYIIPTYAVWDRAEDIELSELPDSFVLKCNHYGGNDGVFLVGDKSRFDLASARKSLSRTLCKSLYDTLREWPYRDVRRRILAEEMLGEDIADYKFHCFGGHVDSVMVCLERGSGDTKFYYFDKDWNLLRYDYRGQAAPEGFTLPKPPGMDHMFEIAATLSRGIPFVRVDLYNVGGRIYFGEMTFYPASGFDDTLLPETDLHFGNLLTLPIHSGQ